jgi:hypothetical protein
MGLLFCKPISFSVKKERMLFLQAMVVEKMPPPGTAGTL